MFNYGDFNTALIILALACAVAGWAVIEFILWLFSFIHISFGG